MELIKGLEWRYATKKFDPTKKIEKEDFDKLKKAIQLSASSYGLQLYKVIIVKNNELKQKLYEVGNKQSQFLDSDAVIIFCNYTKISDTDIDKYTSLIAKTRNVSLDDVKGMGDYIKKTISNQSPEAQNKWTAKQTYIALSNLLSAAAELKIDACPMEGFSNEGFNEVLGLNEKNLNAAVVATVGYRAEDDAYANKAKVRKPEEELFEEIV